jgi:ADP-ribosyl-[dinitrogen reductase] hydrolase
LACGDALGRPLEFKSPHRIKEEHGRVTDMLANGTHGQPAGTITDDTELALCIAESLEEEGEFDPPAVVEKFVEWYESDPFDIGRLTASTLRRHAAGGDWREVGIEDWKHLREGSNAGNGSVMRCAPYALAFHSDLEDLTIASRVSSALTHADPRCQWSCVILNATISGLLHGVDQPLVEALDLAEQAPDEVSEAIESVVSVVSESASLDEINLENSGYVVTTLQAGLYYGLTAETAEDAIIDAVMKGGDTDTIGAVAGTIAGARFGENSIPERWTAEIREVDQLRQYGKQLALKIFDISQKATDFPDEQNVF